MGDSFVIERRFRGPPASGNGGYSAGAVASFIDGPAEVTLRTPPPLDRPIAVERDGAGVRALDGESLVAEAKPEAPALDPPGPVSFDDAEAALRAFEYGVGHPFPECFVCGPAREPGDGLRIFAAPVAGTDVLAAPWHAPESFARDDGSIDERVVWAALDCPGGFAAMLGRDDLMLLGRLTAELRAPVVAGEQCVVVAWPLGRDGRKHLAGSALYGPDGSLRALARATWIAVSR